MMTATIGKGIVRFVQGGTALVEVENLDACASCRAKTICGQDARKPGMLHARNTLHATVGQTVGLTEYRDILTKVSFMQYSVPLLGFFLGVFIPYYSGVSIPAVADELALFCFGLSGLLLGGAISWKWIRRETRMHEHFFEISAIYSEVLGNG